MKQNLSLYRGDSKTYTIRFRNSAGTALNITGWIITLTIKRSFDDPDISAVFQKIVTPDDPTHGICTITLENSDTQNFPISVCHYDIQAKTDVSKIYTIIIGQYHILEDVTRAH